MPMWNPLMTTLLKGDLPCILGEQTKKNHPYQVEMPVYSCVPYCRDCRDCRAVELDSLTVLTATEDEITVEAVDATVETVETVD